MDEIILITDFGANLLLTTWMLRNICDKKG